MQLGKYNIFIRTKNIIANLIKYSLWVLVILPIIVLFVYQITKRYSKATRELSRLQSVNGSPIISHFNETLDGLSTIRVFRKQDEFSNVNITYCNNKAKSAFWREAAKKWFSIRINLISSSVLLFTSILWVRKYNH